MNDMGNTIRIIVAEDDLEAREIIIKQINKFQDYDIQLTECESYTEALAKINESEKSAEPYHFLFIDIDFTGDDKGGKRDSGFNLIKRAFEICPISIISTYSAQYKAADLEPEHQTMVRNGLVVYTFDKDHKSENPKEWFSKGFKELLDTHNAELWFWDIWANHQTVKSFLKKNKIVGDTQHNLLLFDEITTNLDTILFLLQRRKLFNADRVLFRLLLQLYHRNLEIYITSDKEENTIRSESDANYQRVKEHVNDLFKDDIHFEFKEKKSFLRKLAAFTDSYIYRFGHILNWYRNGSVHPDKKFDPELSNIFYANLVLTLFIGGKNDVIKINEIKNHLLFHLGEEKGKRDLMKLIEYISV